MKRSLSTWLVATALVAAGGCSASGKAGEPPGGGGGGSGASCSPDTAAKLPPGASGLPPKSIVKVALSEYKSGFLTADGTFSSFFFANAIGKVQMTPFDLGGRKVVDVAPGFNVLSMIDDHGEVWTSVGGSVQPRRVDSDSTGAAFTCNLAIYGYFSTYVTLRADGSLWYWGNDDYRLFGGSATSPIVKPVRLSPPGLVFQKVALGNSIIALTQGGDVYQWSKGGSPMPTKRVLPRPASDIFASHYDVNGCLVPDGAGATSGYPYIWGSEYGFWGGNTGYAEPTSVKALWQVTVPIRAIAASQNAIHYIDDQGRLFGIGDNPNGEIGNGQELVNHAERYHTPYEWSWTKGEAFTGAPPLQVAPAIKWKALFKGNAFAFYTMALDADGQLYSWGRQKSFVLGNGYIANQEANYPNALDVLTPTRIDPLNAVAQPYDFTPYRLDAGADQTISGTSATLSGNGTPSALIAPGNPANGKKSIGYTVASFQWTEVSGPPGATFADAGAAKTTVNGLKSGTYVFRLQMTDNNTATISANTTVTVQ